MGQDEIDDEDDDCDDMSMWGSDAINTVAADVADGDEATEDEKKEEDDRTLTRKSSMEDINQVMSR